MTGASTLWTPALLACSACLMDASGSMVLISIQRAPFFMPRSAPLSPMTILSTTSWSGREVMTTSTDLPSSIGERCATAPFALTPALWTFRGSLRPRGLWGSGTWCQSHCLSLQGNVRQDNQVTNRFLVSFLTERVNESDGINRIRDEENCSSLVPPPGRGPCTWIGGRSVHGRPATRHRAELKTNASSRRLYPVLFPAKS